MAKFVTNGVDHHYRGDPATRKVKVFRHGRRKSLPLRDDICCDGRGGWNWGYPGQGPRGLAMALLADVLNDDARALALQCEFARRVVCMWPMDKPWAIEAAEIRRIAAEIECVGGVELQQRIDLTRALLEAKTCD